MLRFIRFSLALALSFTFVPSAHAQIPTDQQERLLLAEKFIKASCAHSTRAQIAEGMRQKEQIPYRVTLWFIAASEVLSDEDYTRQHRVRYNDEYKSMMNAILKAAPEQRQPLFDDFMAILDKDLDDALKLFKQYEPLLRDKVAERMKTIGSPKPHTP